MSDSKERKVSYPTLYFTCDTACDIPDKGTATIKFRKVEDAENTRDPKDPKYRYELEVQGIEIEGMDEGDDEEEAPIDMLKKGLRKALKKEEE